MSVVKIGSFVGFFYFAVQCWSYGE